jgi:exoribonuclease R
VQLGLDAYVHITSPIRRLVDILNQILFMTDVSDSCRAFYNKWIAKLDQINRATKDIRRVQMDCELLVACARVPEMASREYVGIVFDRDDETTYSVYIEELKLVTRVKSVTSIESGSRVQIKIYVFNDEYKLCKKIKSMIVS